MGPASKNSSNTSSCRIGKVDTVVKFKPKQMVKEKMTGGNREHGRRKKNCATKIKIAKVTDSLHLFKVKGWGRKTIHLHSTSNFCAQKADEKQDKINNVPFDSNRTSSNNVTIIMEQ